MNIKETIKNFDTERKKAFIEACIKVAEKQDRKYLDDFFKEMNLSQEDVDDICEKALKNKFDLVAEELQKKVCKYCEKEYEAEANNNYEFCSEECEKKYMSKKESIEDNNNISEENEMSLSKLVAEGYLQGLDDFEKSDIKESVSLAEKGDDFIKGYEAAIKEKRDEEQKIAESLNLYDIVKEIRKLKEDLSKVEESEEEVVERDVEYDRGYAYGLVECEKGLEEMSVKDEDSSKYAIGYRDAWNLTITERKVEEKTEEVENKGLDLFNEKVSEELKKEILENIEKSINKEIEESVFQEWFNGLKEKIEADVEEKKEIIEHVKNEYNKIVVEIEEDVEDEIEEEEENVEDNRINVTEIVEKYTKDLFESDKEKVKELILKLECKDEADLEEQIKTIIEEFKVVEEVVEESKVHELSEKEKFMKEKGWIK